MRDIGSWVLKFQPVHNSHLSISKVYKVGVELGIYMCVLFFPSDFDGPFWLFLFFWGFIVPVFVSVWQPKCTISFCCLIELKILISFVIYSSAFLFVYM